MERGQPGRKEEFRLYRPILIALIMGVMALAPGVVMADDGDFLSREESLVYRVAYGPSHLADLDLTIGCEDQGRLEAKLVAESQGMTNRVHPFRVRLDTNTDLNGAATSWAQTWIREKGSTRRYRSRFDNSPQVATEASIGGNESREIIGLPTAGHDLLSWIMHLRRDVADQGRLSESKRYALWDGWKLVWLDVTPGDVEIKETPLGDVRAQSFRLRRTRLHHEGDERFEPREEIEELGTIWIEVAGRALPVAMAFRAPIGNVRIRLDDYESTGC